MEIEEILSDRYQIVGVIGRGGMANVYEAYDKILDREVAIKVLRYDFQDNEEAKARFHREAVSSSQLMHHNIVEVYDVDEKDGKQYIVMEYVKGKDLKSYIDAHHPLPLEEVVAIMTQILSAIEVAHDHQLIHRDIKPQNILVSEDVQVKISDFGIALALSESSLTQANTLLGSVHYLSPEQARGNSATVKSDIYALGIVLYELLTGHVPFEGESAVAIALKHFQEPVPRIREEKESVPQAMENVVLRATAKDPADRYDSVHSMLVDLSTCLDESRKDELMYIPTQSLRTLQKNSPTQKNTGAKSGPKSVPPPTAIHEELDGQYDQVQPPLPPSKPWIRYVIWGLLSICLVLGIYLGVGLFMKNATVPDLHGKTVEEARQELKDNHLSLGEEELHWDDELAVGQVIDSKPTAGSKMTKNSTVDVRVSNGPAQEEVGDYVGDSYEKVRQILTKRGFIVERRGIATSNAQAGQVLDQSLEPGARVVPSQTSITLTVGNGLAEDILMQDFYNLSVDMVDKFAEEYGLNVDYLYEPHDFIPENQIIEQTPAHNAPLKAGDTLEVLVSTGPSEERIVSKMVEIPIDYQPTYHENDKDEENPLPNKIEVYIGDANHDIKQVAQEFEITKSRTIKIVMYLLEDGRGQYRVVRDGEIIDENDEITP